MSVAQLTASELGAFAAIAHKLELVSYDKLMPLCRLISAGNCAAWADTYEDRIEPADEFRLQNDPPARRRERFDNSERTRQRVLVEGMDCLAGQQDLF